MPKHEGLGEFQKKALVVAALAALAAGQVVLGEDAKTPAQAPAATAAKGECSGVNSCKGQGECGGKGHSCAGYNECKGKGWITLTKAECDAKKGTWVAR
ncbi:MAG TPA: hypothetical protein VL588_05975 [Bdellovibrionota bacterium]|jgi:hypothetical protein|nr:hypothetical protein [Bdellovibrionota bacterium]